MPSNLQSAKQILDNVLTLLGGDGNLTEEQRASIVAECRRCREELVQVESAEFARSRYAKWFVGESYACQTIHHKAKALQNRVEDAIFMNRTEVVLRGPVNKVIAAQPCDKKKDEDIATPNRPCQDPNRGSSSSASNDLNGHANSVSDHGEDGVRLPMLSESDSRSRHHSMDTKSTNPTLKKNFTETQEDLSSGKSQTKPVVTRHKKPTATQRARVDPALLTQRTSTAATNGQSKRENRMLRYEQADSREQNSVSDIKFLNSSTDGFTMNVGGHGHAGPGRLTFWSYYADQRQATTAASDKKEIPHGLVSHHIG
ncbi:hypothetical protein SCLCIDRAFT_6663 [Scleroderma citrinum Foug A]|uniref:Uncharacterized protein n=1 Tax=Scleroderma citrinum Foug A TaxID=1036808 RepID=A0A0C3EMX0_9AGAM|nr:hypothetical protein SCLCIDRAFT_6663 [Scleroderma citrinum Foug A]